MRYVLGLVAASGLFLLLTGESKAQMGTPSGFSYGYPNFSSHGNSATGLSNSSLGSMGYGRGYGGLSASSYPAGPGAPVVGGTGYGYRPATSSYPQAYSTYNRAYSGYARPANPSTYVNRPYYGTYGYQGYGYRQQGGVRPFQGFGRMFR